MPCSLANPLMILLDDELELLELSAEAAAAEGPRAAARLLKLTELAMCCCFLNGSLDAAAAAPGVES